MKKLFLITAISFSTFIANAQLLSFKASTGDVEMDGVLTNVDVQARGDINLFKNDVSVSFNIPKPRIETALKVLSPGDLFMAAQMSISIGQPFETVVEKYRVNKSKGWGVIAKEMGIKPGSAEFHAMKKSMKTKGAKKQGGASKEKGKEKPQGGKEKSEGGKDKGGKGKGNKK
jgi:hypothetical protein